ncbi:MAG TPA: NAD(P)/FAD-dependent oxidoreductase [Actinomycetota bacterium]|nr:NAD(P)/FAD-dependent oxidoreductase [Actinomycetota bacterium]
MAITYDAIVAGARCAGAPTAMLLARQGYRVLLVDRATFPSDTLSTLVIHAPGVAALERWGLLPRVLASGCPPIERYSFDFGPVRLAGRPRPCGDVATAYAPRRHVLDKILVDAAAATGVEVREGFDIEEVVFEDGAAVGIRGRERGAPRVEERARVVVGADGRNSRIAESVGAPRYREKGRLQQAYYSFWRDLPTQDLETVIRPYRGWGVIPTGDGLTLVVLGWPYAESEAYKADIEGNFLKTLELVPEFAQRVRQAERVEPFRGGAVVNVLRKPYGPGWALVGDAGYTKDPITAQGISDAFRDAELCSGALAESLRGAAPFEDAMAGYHRARDARALPIYEFTAQIATLEPPPPEMQQLIGAVAGNQAAMDAFASVVAGTLSASEFFDPANLERVLGAPAPA